MTDQNNSVNNPVPAQPSTQQVPTPSNNWNGNSIVYTMPTGTNNGQWITYTITGVDLSTITIDPVDPPVEKKAKKKSDKDGCFCKKCKEWSEFSEPNQEDGTFVCYACRKVW